MCRERPLTIDAWVVLPDHLHAVWTQPPDDDDISTRWRLIKSFFVRCLSHFEWRSSVRQEQRERGIWQHRFWEHASRDDAEVDQKAKQHLHAMAMREINRRKRNE